MQSPIQYNNIQCLFATSLSHATIFAGDNIQAATLNDRQGASQ